VAGAADWVAGLERIRERFHRWIDRLEDRLDDEARAAAPGGDLERAARELEAKGEELRAEAERRDREWAAHLDALERDRRLLAEAWERLEREQLVLAPRARAEPCPPVASPPPAPPRSALPASEPENPVDRAILHQFETLRRDVRRKAEAHRPR
jgi:hypothetical protein